VSVGCDVHALVSAAIGVVCSGRCACGDLSACRGSGLPARACRGDESSERAFAEQSIEDFERNLPEPLQALESALLRELLPAADACGGCWWNDWVLD
jgi:hypothetical protein